MSGCCYYPLAPKLHVWDPCLAHVVLSGPERKRERQRDRERQTKINIEAAGQT